MSVISKMDLETYIVGLWEQMSNSVVLNWDMPNLALRFDIAMSVNHNGYLADGNTHVEAYDQSATTYISVIVTSRHRVYVAASSEKMRFEFTPEDFTNTSNHDSCWKSDGLTLLTRAYFDMCEYVVRNWPENEAPAPKDLNTRIQIGDWMGNNPLQFVTVSFGPKRKDNDYFNSLVSIEKLEFKVSLHLNETKELVKPKETEKTVSAIYLHEERFGPISVVSRNLLFTSFAQETVVDKNGRALATGTVVAANGPVNDLKEYFKSKGEVWTCSSPRLGDWVMLPVIQD
jgi:hypothetical protein